MHKFGVNPFIQTNEDAAINMKRMTYATERAYNIANDFYRMSDMEQARNRGRDPVPLDNAFVYGDDVDYTD